MILFNHKMSDELHEMHFRILYCVSLSKGFVVTEGEYNKLTYLWLYISETV